MPLPLITAINNTNHFAEMLQTNPGLIIIKFGATWCGPCKRIEGLVHDWMGKMPETAQCVMIDIDESFEIYAFLSKKRMINGVPAILCYDKNNLNYIPNDSVVGADNGQVNSFFQRCMQKLAK